jgi:hypothetical protein
MRTALIVGVAVALSAAAPAVSAPSDAKHRCARGSMHVVYKARHKCLSVRERKLIYGTSYAGKTPIRAKT